MQQDIQNDALISDTSIRKKENLVQRNLKPRHVSMIALGGSIGTGLFVASGAAIANSGPGSTLIAYLIAGVMIYFLMNSLGELTTYVPSSSAFSTFPSRFVDPAVGFAMGWNYWLGNALTVSVEMISIGILVSFWVDQKYNWIWSLLALLLVFTVNAISVKNFGEVEFWISLIKVIVIVIFIIVGFLAIFGIFGGDPVYFNYFVYKEAPFVNGFLGFIEALVIASFSFAGVEMFGLTAGESDEPEKTLPKATKQISFRIIFFYIFSFFVISLNIRYDDEAIINSSGSEVKQSPFTLVFENIGLNFAAHFMNAVIIIAIFSACNSSLYVCSRIFFSMAQFGYSPKIFEKTTKFGVPLLSLIFTAFVSLCVFCIHFIGDRYFLFLIKAISLCDVINWCGISLCHYRFRSAYILQGGHVESLTFYAKCFPFGPFFTMSICILLLFIQDLNSIIHGVWDSIIVEYYSVFQFIVFFLYYRIRHKTKFVHLERVDLSRDVDNYDVNLNDKYDKLIGAANV